MPLSGRVHLRVNATGRVETVELTQSVGHICADEVITTVAASMWYHWLPNDRFPGPVDLDQPITLATARDWGAPVRQRFY